MKRLLIFFIAILFMTGCSCGVKETNTPKGEIQKLFSDYNSLSSDVLVQLDSVMESENLTETQKTKYKEVLKKQYEDLKYKIQDEVITDDAAIVNVEIEVYNLRKIITDADKYVNDNKDKFYTEGTENIDDEKVWNYKLEEMKKASEKTKYTIDFSLTKLNNKWVLDDLLETDRQKIHGLYTK